MSMSEPTPEVKISAEDVWNPELREQYQRQQEHYAGGVGLPDYMNPDYEEVTVTLRTEFEVNVWDILNDIFCLLSEKNRKYGDAALNPARIFSDADETEQIKVRIDDKLNRIKNAQDDDTEDAVKDLTGYLILFMIARGF